MSETSFSDREPATCNVGSGDLGLDNHVLEMFDIASWSRARPVWEGERCIWHADTTDKPPDDLAAAIGMGDLHGAKASHPDLSSVSFPDGSGLVAADLSEADLRGADLSGTTMLMSDLSEADLLMGDLSEADLRAADLRDANLRDVNLAGVTLARSTQIGSPSKGLEQELADSDAVSDERCYDIIARVNHELRTAYSANGLIKQARRARVRERRARRKEALAEGGWRGTVEWFGSLLSKVFTGYGVQLTWIAGVMVLLYLGSVAVYAWEGMPVYRSLYYRVVTFTTSPPVSPSQVGFGQAGTLVAMFETFAGTAAIVFLGYVLGAREQV